MNFEINIPKDPKTIQEKLIWLQFYDTMNYLKPLCADKLMVHEYCKEKLGKDICVPVIKVYNKPGDIKLEELPKKFSLKTNHASGQVILCRDKSNFNLDEAKSKLHKWLSKPFGVNTREPHYLYIQRKCYAEELLIENNNNELDLVDYKFLCFNGKPRYMQLIQDRHGPGRRLQYYDMNMKFTDFCRTDFKNRPDLRTKDILPKQLELMKEYAKKLAEPFKFVRVDFYEVCGKVYLGEMTFTPGAMLFNYKNPKTSILFGDMLKLQ